MSKYDPLYKYLAEIKVTLTYKEIEQILGSTLPESAYKYRAWWENNGGNHVQANSWMDAGWMVDKVDLGISVTFKRLKF